MVPNLCVTVWLDGACSAAGRQIVGYAAETKPTRNRHQCRPTASHPHEVLDIRMPVLDGLTAAREFAAKRCADGS